MYRGGSKPQKHPLRCWGRSGMLELCMTLKEIFRRLLNSVYFFLNKIRLRAGNVVMTASDICGKRPILGDMIYKIT